MNTKHTPGPWKAHKIETGHGLAYTPVAAKTLLAKVYSEAFGDHEQSEANARLIAAAPDLLEALQDMHQVLHEAMSTGGWVPTPVHASFHQAWMDMNKAIAKATGEAS